MKKFSTLLAALLLSVAVSSSAHAQRFGGQVSWGSDSDLGVGARVEIPLANTLSKTEPFSKAFLLGAFDLYFPDCGGGDCQWWEINPALAIPLKAQSIKPYVGAGLNIAHISVDLGSFGTASNTEMGLALLGGLKFALGSMDAFSEARLALSGGEQFALSFGVLFGKAGASGSAKK